MKRFQSSILVLGFLLLAGGCADDPVAGDPVTLPEGASNAPSSLSLGGRTLELSAYLVRDFQPFNPPRAVYAVTFLRTDDLSDAPDDVEFDTIWVEHGSQIWRTSLLAQESGQRHVLRARAGDGPAWNPGGVADVVVRVVVDGSPTLLRLPDVEIVRAD